MMKLWLVWALDTSVLFNAFIKRAKEADSVLYSCILEESHHNSCLTNYILFKCERKICVEEK